MVINRLLSALAAKKGPARTVGGCRAGQDHETQVNFKIIDASTQNNQENPDIMIGITLRLAYSMADPSHITREYAPAKSPTSL
jgi:hypothetical protein